MRKNTTTVAATLAVAGLLATTPPALAQNDDTPQPDTQQCGAMHMILANGTGDSDRHRDPNKDVGFFAQLSTYVLNKAADIDITADRSGGIADSLTVNTSGSSKVGAGATAAQQEDIAQEADATSGEENSVAGAAADFLDKHNTGDGTSNKEGNAEQADETEQDFGELDGLGDLDQSADTPNEEDNEQADDIEPGSGEADDKEDTVLPVTRTFVNYPSAAGGFQFFAKPTAPGKESNQVSYLESMDTGVESAEEQIKKIDEACGDNTKFFLAGYSQGAEVIEHVARKIGAGNGPVSADRIAGVSLFASPNRQADTPLAINGADSVGGNHAMKVTEGLTHYDTPAGGGISADKTGTDGLGELEDRTVSWCLQGDIVCGLPVDSEIARALATSMEGVDINDPQSSLEQMSEGLNMALTVNDVEKTDPEDIDFGDGGFSLTSADTSSGDSSPSALSKEGRQSAFQTFIDSTISTARSGSGSANSSDVVGSFVGGLSNPTAASGDTPASRQDWESAGQDAATAAGDTLRDEVRSGLDGGQSTSGVDRSTSLESRLLNAGAQLGGMALGTGITTVRKALSPESLASIAMAGATGGPQAAAGIAAVNFSKAGMELLEPENASMTVRQGMQALKDSGLGIGEVSELAVALSSWKSLNEHQGYTTRPIMADGRTALDVTRDWAVAAAADSGAEIDDQLDANDEDVIADFRSEPDANGETVTVDRQKLRDILEQLNKSEAQTTEQPEQSEQEQPTTDTDQARPADQEDTNETGDDVEETASTPELDTDTTSKGEVNILG